MAVCIILPGEQITLCANNGDQIMCASHDWLKLYHKKLVYDKVTIIFIIYNFIA